MDLSVLPGPLRSRVEAFLQKKPKAQPSVERMLVRRAAMSPEEQVRFDQLLEGLVTPSNNAWVWGLMLLLLPISLLAYSAWRESQYEAALERSSPALAYIERAERGDCTFGDTKSICMALSLKVHPAQGDPYSAKIEHRIATEFLPRVQAGQWLTVGVLDEPAGKQVLFDERAMSVPPPQPPAALAPR